MNDEGTLRAAHPEIPWDEPVQIHVFGRLAGRWVCRYCIAMRGIKGDEVSSSPFAYDTRHAALDHIKQAHHE